MVNIGYMETVRNIENLSSYGQLEVSEVYWVSPLSIHSILSKTWKNTLLNESADWPSVLGRARSNKVYATFLSSFWLQFDQVRPRTEHRSNQMEVKHNPGKHWRNLEHWDRHSKGRRSLSLQLYETTRNEKSGISILHYRAYSRHSKLSISWGVEAKRAVFLQSATTCQREKSKTVCTDAVHNTQLLFDLRYIYKKSTISYGV